MFALVIWIVITLAIFGFVMWIFLFLNSGSISQEENEREYIRACQRAREIWKRRQDKDV